MKNILKVYGASGDTCEGDNCDLEYPEVHKKYVYWMAGMQLLNAFLPGIYYSAIVRYRNNSYDDDDEDFAVYKAVPKKPVNRT